MEWESVIGLEVHAQLFTNSKMFCSCKSGYVQGSANTRVCPVCLGMPGSLPVINKQAVEFVMMTGLALNCVIGNFTQFDRKNYPYPDLMKGYQISQYSNPIASNGWVDLEDSRRRIGITRVHLEEDVAKLQHVKTSEGQQYSLVDVNRSGIPLMETVTEPDIRNPDEAHEYLIQLHSILQFLGVSTADMEKGAFRCDANISVRPKGTTELLSKVEVKNMNSFRSVHQALEFEIARQIASMEANERVIQETRGWNEERQITISQRTKEYANDYRYFPEPDLPPIYISNEWVSEVKENLPELPLARRTRYITDYALSQYDASLLTNSKPVADFFENTLLEDPLAIGTVSVNSLPTAQKAKAVANWVTGEMAHLMKQYGTGFDSLKIMPAALSDLVTMVHDGVIGSPQARQAFEEMFHSGKSPKEIVEEQNLSQISDLDSVLPTIDQVLTENQQAVSDFLQGKQGAIRFLVGQVMRLTKGRANPNIVTELLNKRLSEKQLE